MNCRTFSQNPRTRGKSHHHHHQYWRLEILISDPLGMLLTRSTNLLTKIQLKLLLKVQGTEKLGAESDSFKLQ